ncbi:MAG: hypothetical protein JWO31_3415 [Phycisphaerales bacterium]|nr:hypothetical protein [Phycisphaerales bacterium]
MRAVKLFRHLRSKKDDVATVLGKQYLRSATSIGANLVEARSGESRADFDHKCAISQKETRECLYWLQLISRVDLVPADQLAPLARETE